jgi:Protein of unknown function (DUF2934)
MATAHQRATETAETSESIAAAEGEGMVPHPNGEREEIPRLAYQHCHARGCSEGSPEEDWFRAEEEIKSQPMPDGNATAMKSETAKVHLKEK